MLNRCFCLRYSSFGDVRLLLCFEFMISSAAFKNGIYISSALENSQSAFTSRLKVYFRCRYLSSPKVLTVNISMNRQLRFCILYALLIQPTHLEFLLQPYIYSSVGQSCEEIKKNFLHEKICDVLFLIVICNKFLATKALFGLSNLYYFI